MKNKTPIEAYKEKKLKEFDEKFGISYYEDGGEDLRSKGRKAGCDDCNENHRVRIEHREFLSSALDGLVSQIREEVEAKLPKERQSRCLDCASSDECECKDSDHDYNMALQEFKEVVLSVLGKK